MRKKVLTVTELWGQLTSDGLVTELKWQLPLTFSFSLDENFTLSKCPFYLAGHHYLLILSDREDSISAELESLETVLDSYIYLFFF